MLEEYEKINIERSHKEWKLSQHIRKWRRL